MIFYLRSSVISIQCFSLLGLATKNEYAFVINQQRNFSKILFCIYGFIDKFRPKSYLR